MSAVTESWSVESARKLYNIDGWGIGYFRVDEEGYLVACPSQDPAQTIRITDVIAAAKEEGLSFPLQIRFQDLLRHRVESLNEAFTTAIRDQGYKGKYTGVFPIKVNQMREVVEEILDAGKPYNYGVEAGSKPELIAALSMHKNYDSLIVCNGYKDTQFIRFALNGNRIGKKVIMVAEKLEEVRTIIQVAREMKVKPMIGVRVKLAAKSTGKWATSSGDNAKFGLSTADILDAVEMLREVQMEDALKLIHFHIGSQIPDIQVITRAVREGARFFAKLIKHGCQSLEYIDVGGGLGVDYDGSKSVFSSSINYSMQEYANDIVYAIQDVCDEEKVSHPNIVSESGRAIVAHHSMIVVEVFGKIEKLRHYYARNGEGRPVHKLIDALVETRDRLTKNNVMECYHDLLYYKEQSQSLFDLGYLELDDKASIDTLYWEIAARIVFMYADQEYIPEEIQELKTSLSDQYLCNFSVFQSLPDYWALGQLFPIVPIHRLQEQPDRVTTLADITCDSDGKVNKFIDLHDVKDTLQLHAINGEPYYLGLFMTGAYQDVMGDLHNLFGRVNEVHLFLDPDEDLGWYIEETIEGSTIGEVLSMNQYVPSDLVRSMKKQVDQAIKQDIVKPSEGIKLLQEYEKALLEYTYLKSLH
ncbi:MAG: biosynthetic arginine decarboxylase [Bacteroidetes bacterium]|nr:biosynthetic arginine decarboxylase [Bacteroidota bacterium]